MEIKQDNTQESTELSSINQSKPVAYISADIEKALSITIADKAKTLAQIVYDIVPKRGEPRRELYYQALKALMELNRMQGHYLPTQSLKVTIDATKEKLAAAKRVYDEV